MTDNHITALDVLRRFYRERAEGARIHLNHLKLADGTTLSCQDHREAHATLGKSMEVVCFDADGEALPIHEWGEREDDVYAYRTYQQIAWAINRRGGLLLEA